MKQLKKIFHNRNYSFLFLANLTSQIGNVIGLTAFMYFVLDRYTNQPFYATFVELMYSLPTLSVFFLVGVFADRLDRKKIAYNCDVINAILSVILLVSIYFEWIIVAFGILFTRSAINNFFKPAQRALIQGILQREQYPVAAGLNQIVSSLFTIFGSAMGILIYWKIGIVGAILIDSITFLISGLFVRLCKINNEVRLPNGPHTWKELNIKSIFFDFKQGLVYILGNKLLMSLLLGFSIIGIVNGGLAVIPAFIMKYKLAPDTYESMMVIFGIVIGGGLLIGSFVSSLLIDKFKLYQLIIVGLIVSGIFLGTSGFSSNVIMYSSLSFVVAIFLPVINIGIGGWLPSIVEPKMMGRVQGWITPLNMLSHSLTLGLIAITFPNFLTIEWLVFIIGFCLVLIALFYLYALPKYSRENDI